jgi:1-acyl-sn-glycerol-3-phosphate acyltransferase
MFTGWMRAGLRGTVFVPLAVGCMADYFLSSAGENLRSRVRWLQRVARRHAKFLHLETCVHGAPPPRGLIVANHLGYLDIVGMSAAIGCAFVSKKEVADWPFFGAYARLGGTVFVDRERRTVVGDVVEEMRRLLDEGITLVLFPEGTSTDGRQVLPFRTPLFESVLQLGCPVTPCGLRYSCPEASVPDEVCYWGDMSLAPHVANLVTKRNLRIDLHFGESHQPATDRKTLARSMEKEVRRLAGL